MGAAELLRAIKAEKLHVPVVVITPRSEGADAGLLALGAVGCLQRPLTAADLASLEKIALQHIALGFFTEAGEESERQQRRDEWWAKFTSWESAGGWSTM